MSALRPISAVENSFCNFLKADIRGDDARDTPMAQVSNLFTGEEQRNTDTAARIRAPPVTQTFRVLLQPGLV
jgi:hypothetical protein